MNKVSTFARNIWGCFNYKNKEEASAFLKLSTSRGSATVYSALYATIALTFLARLAEDCDGNILGGSIKSSSAIASTIFIEGAITAILSPTSGVIADGSSYRKLMYMIFHCAWIAMIVLQAIIVTTDEPNDTTVLSYMATLILVSVFLELSITLINAYIPEVTDNEQDVHDLNARTFAFLNGFQLLLALFVAGAGIVLGSDADPDESAFTLSQIGAGFVIFVWAYLTIPAIGKLPARGKPKGTDESTGSCSKVNALCTNLQETVTTYPQVGIFLASYMFFFAGVNNVVGLASNFLLEGAGIEPFEVALASAALLFFSVPGALLVAPLMKKMPVKKAYLICVFYWVAVSAVGPFAMVGDAKEAGKNNNTEYEFFNPNNCTLEQQETRTTVEPKGGAFFIVLIFAILYGIGIGTAFPISQSIMVMIIPGGKEAGYFGLKTVAAKLLAWAPALAFVTVNESLENRIDLAFLVIAPFFVMALLTGLFIDLDKAQEDIKDTLHLRHGAQIGARELMKEDAAIAVQVEETVKSEIHSL
mmetsp:Transcript_11362/g.14802  ORF Transcript_11362/g.14802 Transcript_11362/m.14802 type:complete len:532 (+) Transcript_11362:194-1789(+)